MSNISRDVNGHVIYKLGEYIGFFAAFLLFSSMFYLLLSILHKVPKSIKYYHVILAVVVLYALGFLILKLKK